MKNKTKQKTAESFSLTPYQWEIDVLTRQYLPVHKCYHYTSVTAPFLVQGGCEPHRPSPSGYFLHGTLLLGDAGSVGSGGEGGGRWAGTELLGCMRQHQEVSFFPLVLNFGSHPYIMLCSSSPVVFKSVPILCTPN